MSVRQAQADVSAAEFAEWLAYFQLEPWGEERADWRSGIVASTIANRHRGKRESVYRVEDFLPQYGPKPPRKQTPQQMMSIFRMITAAVNETPQAS